MCGGTYSQNPDIARMGRDGNKLSLSIGNNFMSISINDLGIDSKSCVMKFIIIIRILKFVL